MVSPRNPRGESLAAILLKDFGASRYYRPDGPARDGRSGRD
jgi:hypothetical protein